MPRKTFGNINTNTFQEIREKADYQEFRNRFTVRLQEYNMLMSAFTDHEPNLLRIKEAGKIRRGFKEQPPACRMPKLPKGIWNLSFN